MSGGMEEWRQTEQAYVQWTRGFMVFPWQTTSAGHGLHRGCDLSGTRDRRSGLDTHSFCLGALSLTLQLKSPVEAVCSVIPSRHVDPMSVPAAWLPLDVLAFASGVST